MRTNDLTAAITTLKEKATLLQKGTCEAHERARTYYNERVTPAEKDLQASDEEMESIFNTYDDLCSTYDDLANKLEIATNAIEALEKAESALRIAEVEGVWEGK